MIFEKSNLTTSAPKQPDAMVVFVIPNVTNFVIGCIWNTNTSLVPFETSNTTVVALEGSNGTNYDMVVFEVTNTTVVALVVSNGTNNDMVVFGASNTTKHDGCFRNSKYNQTQWLYLELLELPYR